MGNSSSQVEQDKRDGLGSPDPEKEDLNEDATADAASDAGSNQTSASRALARDLERSVMQSSQDYQNEEPPKKRRKRKSTQSRLSAAEEVPDERLDVAAVPPTRDIASKPEIGESNGDDYDEDLLSHGIASGNELTNEDRSGARRHLVRDLRRLKKTVLVNSGKAKWAPRINGAKWDVEKLPPGQWLNRELTDVEKETLERCKAKVKDAKQRLEEFDRVTVRSVLDREEYNDDPMSENEHVTAGENGMAKANGEATKQSGAGKEHDAVGSFSLNERKRQRKARRKSERNIGSEDQEEMDEQIDLPLPEPEHAQTEKPRKKRKRLQPQTMTSSPPQPAVQEGSPPLRSMAGKHKTDLVKSWLNSQDPSEDMVAASEQDELERSGSSRKRKRVSKHQEDDDDDYQAVSHDEDEPQTADSDEELPTLKPAVTRSVKVKSSKSSIKPKGLKEQANSEGSQVPGTIRSAGLFTTEEKSVADSIFNHVLQSEGIDEATLKHRICSWRTVGTFKEEIEAAFPARDKPSVRRFCQRRYHILERGAWTAEQDDDLRNAHANYPDQWKKLEEIVGRTAADCKDRWTMHLQHSKTTGAWSREEEDTLMATVERAIDAIKNDRGTDPNLAADRDALEKALSWKVVARDLGNKRNHKQCREKWERLKRRDKRESTIPAAKQPLEPAKELEKARAAKKAVRKFEIGDFYDIFVEIYTSFDDTSAHYYDEDSTIWSIVSLKNPASRFNLSYRSGYLRRTALNHALQEWKIDSKKVRRKLEKSETLPAKAKILAKLLEKSYAGRLHVMSRTFMPEMAGKSIDEIAEAKTERKRSWAEKHKVEPGSARATGKTYIRSKEFVEDTDEEDEEDEEADANPATPAIDEEDEEKESDDSRSEEEQSVCQRRLDAQINSRELDLEDKADSEGVVHSIEARSRRQGNVLRKSSSQEPSQNDDGQGEDLETEDCLVKMESESGSEDLQQHRSPMAPDPNDPVDAEMLRRFDAEINGNVSSTTEVKHLEEDSDSGEEVDQENAAIDAFAPFTTDIKYLEEETDSDGENDEEADEEDADGLKSRYAVSLEGAETPVLGPAKFMKSCRKQRTR